MKRANHLKELRLRLSMKRKKYQTQTFDTEQDFLKWYNDVRI